MKRFCLILIAAALLLALAACGAAPAAPDNALPAQEQAAPAAEATPETPLAPEGPAEEPGEAVELPLPEEAETVESPVVEAGEDSGEPAAEDDYVPELPTPAVEAEPQPVTSEPQPVPMEEPVEEAPEEAAPPAEGEEEPAPAEEAAPVPEPETEAGPEENQGSGVLTDPETGLEYSASTLILGLDPELKEEGFTALLDKYGLHTVYVYENFSLAAVSTEKPCTLEELDRLIAALEGEEGVLSVEKDQVIRLTDPILADG